MIAYTPLLKAWCAAGGYTISTVLYFYAVGLQQLYPAMVEASKAGHLSLGMCLWIAASGALAARLVVDMLPLSHLRWTDFDRVAASCFFHLTESLLVVALCTLFDPKLRTSESSLVCLVAVQMLWKTLHHLEDLLTVSMEAHAHYISPTALIRPAVLLVVNGAALTYTVDRPRLLVSPSLLVLAYDFAVLCATAVFQLLNRGILVCKAPADNWEGKLLRIAAVGLARNTALLVIHVFFFLYFMAQLRMPAINGIRSMIITFTAAVQEFSRLYIQITLNDNIDKWMPNASHEDLGGDDDTTPCTICFEDMLFEDSNVKKLYPCGHMFHKVCIVAWYSRSMRTQCPYCRQRLKSPPHMTGHVTKARSRFLASASAAT